MDKLVQYRKFFGNDAVESDLRTIGNAIALYPNGNVKTGSFPIPHNLATDSEIRENTPVTLNELIDRIETKKRDRQIKEDKEFAEMLRIENLDNFIQNPDDISYSNIDEMQLLQNQIAFVKYVIGGIDNE